MKTYLLQELSSLKESENTLRKNNELKQKRIEILEHNVEALTQALLQAAKQRFGASREKAPDDDRQLDLFDKVTELPSEEENVEMHAVKAHACLKRRSGDKARLIADIPREVVECILNEDDVCDVCSSPLKVIGKKTVRTELEYIPARLKTIEYAQYIFKRSTCGSTDDYPDAVFKKASVPAPVMSRSLASATSVAWIMYQKYVQAVPLYRQEKEWLRMGIALTRSIMSNWMIQCAASWLKPIYERMHEKLLTYDLVMSDETTIQCNKEEGRKASSKSYLWLHRNGPFEGDQVILFQYTRTRAGENARKLLHGFSGYLISDYSDILISSVVGAGFFQCLRLFYRHFIPIHTIA